jgi:Dihaem cytochrome c
MFKYQKFLQRGLVIGLLATGVAMSAAQADDDEEYGERQSSKMIGENRGRDMHGVQMNAKFKAECSNCHIAYTPNLLPAESWRKIMSGLDKHFGSDASLTEAENKEITASLKRLGSSKSITAARFLLLFGKTPKSKAHPIVGLVIPERIKATSTKMI